MGNILEILCAMPLNNAESLLQSNIKLLGELILHVLHGSEIEEVMSVVASVSVDVHAGMFGCQCVFRW